MKTKRTLLRCSLGFGILLTCSPLLGLLGTAFGIRQAFQTLERSGIGDPRQLSGAVGEVLISLAVGLMLMLPGILLAAVSIIALRNLNRPLPSSLPPPFPPPQG